MNTQTASFCHIPRENQLFEIGRHEKLLTNGLHRYMLPRFYHHSAILLYISTNNTNSATFLITCTPERKVHFDHADGLHRSTSLCLEVHHYFCVGAVPQEKTQSVTEVFALLKSLWMAVCLVAVLFWFSAPGHCLKF